MKPSFSRVTAALFVLLQLNGIPLAAAGELIFETTKHVTCSRPSKTGDRISVHYKGRLQSNGVEFDQSYKRGKPFTFSLGAGQVIKGWDQGLQGMCPGEARTLTIPPELAYGEWGSPPMIPGGATLIFDTELMDIVGVEQEMISTSDTVQATSTTEPAFTIATAPPEPPAKEVDKIVDDNGSATAPQMTSTSTAQATPTATSATDPKTAQQSNEAECHLLGPFALLVQAALGVVAFMSLVFKRWRETPKRPWKIFFFDVSKQVIGSMLLHVLNLVMSMVGTVDVVNAAAKAAESSKDGSNGAVPNPCSYYILNLGIDTTIGIPVLYVLLKALHGVFLYTPLARPKESIKSGNYGTPPKATWWIKQAIIYFIGLTGMKLFVWFLFAALPWLPWVGDWALRWTNGNDALQITFAMFIFPLTMNAVQYWIIDSFIKDNSRREPDGAQYERVHDEFDDDDDDTIDGTEFGIDSPHEVHPKDTDAPAAIAPQVDQIQPVSQQDGGGRTQAMAKS